MTYEIPLLCTLTNIQFHSLYYHVSTKLIELNVRMVFPCISDFKNVDTACCGHGTLNAEGICNATANLCSDRRQYMFWDLFHPTHAAAGLAAITLYGGPTLYVSPINFAQLAAEN